MTEAKNDHGHYRFYGFELKEDSQRYPEVIEWLVMYYDKRGKLYKKVYMILTILRLTLIAGIPVLALSGHRLLNPYLLTAMSSCALIADGIVNVAAAHDKWKSYRRTCDRLCMEHRMFRSCAGAYAGGGEEAFKTFVCRCEQVVGEEGDAWERYMEKVAEEGAGRTGV